MKNNLIKIITGLILILFVSSCVKENFDVVPEKHYTVDFEANSTISALKSLYHGSNVLIDTNIIIKAVVTANDKSGNFYKEIYLQDSTGAINIRLNSSSLYLDYPIGQLIYVKCNGLYLGTYNNVYQLGVGASVDRIEEPFFDDYLFKSDGGVPVEPKLVTISELNDADLGLLIKIEGIQFQNPNQTYADGISHTDRTTVSEDCDGNTLDIRNSGYAVFANDMLPDGNGSIIGINSKFSDYQLKIRTTDEVNFTGARCTKK